MVSRPRKRAPQGFDLDIDGTPVRVSLLPHATARRYILRVSSTAREVLLTMPRTGSAGEARAFAERQRDWIGTKLARLPQRIVFEDGAIIPLRGVAHMIEHRPQARGTVWSEPGEPAPLLAEDALPRLVVAGRYLHLRRRLRDWLEAEIRADMTRAVRQYARRLGVAVLQVQIRDQKSRWGASSQTGTLTFSWRLIFAPPFVIDYLAAHEVAHQKEMNHSPRFWAILRELCPATDRAEAWITTHGRDLHRYDAEQ